MDKRIPRKNPDIVWEAMHKDAVLLEPSTGKYFGLNQVGRSFWQLVDGKTAMNDIIELLLNEYEVERVQLTADLAELTGLLESKGLLSWDSQ